MGKTFTSSNPAERARRNSTKMSSPQQPTMLAYRDENNTTIKYAPSAAAAQQHSNDDSDGEALIQPPEQPSELSEHDKHRRWTEEELEEAFKQYKPEPTKEKKTGLLSGTDGIKTGGALSSLSQGLA